MCVCAWACLVSNPRHSLVRALSHSRTVDVFYDTSWQWDIYIYILHTHTYNHIYIYESELKSSYDGLSTVDYFWPMGYKHFNTNRRSVWTARGTMLKKSHLVTFHEYLGQPMSFSVDPHVYSYTYGSMKSLHCYYSQIHWPRMVISFRAHI